jgi:hypothetical protein
MKYLMKYLVMEGRYNYDASNADAMFATNDKQEAIKAAKDFGEGMAAVFVDEKGDKERIFTARYKCDLGIKE